jgi:hypothetical protein
MPRNYDLDENESAFNNDDELMNEDDEFNDYNDEDFSDCSSYTYN